MGAARDLSARMRSATWRLRPRLPGCPFDHVKIILRALECAAAQRSPQNGVDPWATGFGKSPREKELLFGAQKLDAESGGRPSIGIGELPGPHRVDRQTNIAGEHRGFEIAEVSAFRAIVISVGTAPFHDVVWPIVFVGPEPSGLIPVGMREAIVVPGF